MVVGWLVPIKPRTTRGRARLSSGTNTGNEDVQDAIKIYKVQRVCTRGSKDVQDAMMMSMYKRQEAVKMYKVQRACTRGSKDVQDAMMMYKRQEAVKMYTRQ